VAQASAGRWASARPRPPDASRSTVGSYSVAAMTFTVKPLDASTWPDFVRLTEDHGGVWAGCWCLHFHQEGRAHLHTPEQRRALKEARVRELPDWRITCSFVGRTHRHRGVAGAALGWSAE